MGVHIQAQQGELAETVLITGDPLRAQFIAKTFLEEASCYNRIRGALGFTGYYKGIRVSVQGTGMGIPSTAIYLHEMIHEYGVRQVIRLGSCGSFQPDIRLKDLIIVMSASTDSSTSQRIFPGMNYAPSADFSLLEKAVLVARNHSLRFHVGQILSTDLFYHPDPDAWKIWADWGALAVEMETSMIYSLASKSGVRALSLLTVSDRLGDDSYQLSAAERESGLEDMIRTGLELLMD
ncbi:MAG: purine-nucleoside phosphorylase [Deltaproteobacteria bacterium]|nr:purine-nucleoside phosphorylase [Deltaproteobacteria bacterium]